MLPAVPQNPLFMNVSKPFLVPPPAPLRPPIMGPNQGLSKVFEYKWHFGEDMYVENHIQGIEDVVNYKTKYSKKSEKLLMMP